MVHGKRVKKVCERCGKLTRVTWLSRDKAKSVCRKCYQKDYPSLGNILRMPRGGYISLEEAMNKTYVATPYVAKGNSLIVRTYFPSCMAGRKFKILLEDGK